MRHVLVLLAAVVLSSTLQAQVSVSVNFNVDRQPVWGPTGYDHVEYYYLPDVEAYYYVPQRRFYYFDGGRWLSGSSLPSRYGRYDLYTSYKVVVNEPRPYRNHKMYRDKYSSYKGRHGQEPIRDSRDEKYFVNAKHPEHGNWVKQQKHNGNGKGKGHENKPGRK